MQYPRKRVLIIDDDGVILQLLKATLESNEFECHTARTAMEGLEKAAVLRPAVILLDLMLPQMSGYGFLREIKDKPELAGIPIVVLSSLVDSEVAMGALDLGAVSYLSKSCDARELVSTLAAYAV